MASRLVPILAVIVTAALLPAAALGKEIRSVTITGPGLDSTARVERRGSGSSMGVWAGGTAGAALLLVGLGYVVYRGRRTRPE